MFISDSLDELVLRWFEDLDTSFSLKCAILWRYGEREAVVRLECRPQDYETPERYLCSVAARDLIKKLKGLLDVDTQAVARQKWLDGELKCYKTNQRLYPYIPGTRLERDERINQHFVGVRLVIQELIGRRIPSDLEGRHGPGSTFVDRGNRITVPHKFSTDPALTPSAWCFLDLLRTTAWWRHASTGAPSSVRGNRYLTVPKTSLTDRSIAVEPSVNVFYQLAIGTALRRRLRASHGWDLDRAADLHRQKAKEASLSAEFATLDLSNASDTVAYNLVKLLLPPAWFEVLDSLRSPFTFFSDGVPSRDGADCTKAGASSKVKRALEPRWCKLEKFSSMGNGFTFELETLIFAAIAIYVSRLAGEVGVLGVDVFVFGDDIIVKDGVARDLIAFLNFCGFELNLDKTFVGPVPFRESCGGDYYLGSDVRASFLKEVPSNVQEAIGVANRLSAVRERAALMGRPVAARAWHYAVGRVPLPYRSCRGPKGLGDAVIWDREDRWRVKTRNSIRYVLSVKPGALRIVPLSRFRPGVVLASALYGIKNVGTPEGGRVPPLEGVVPRDAVISFKIGWMAYS